MAKFSKKKSLEEQIKDHDTVFVDEVLAASDEALKDRLMRLAAYDSVLEKKRSEDGDLKSLQEQAKEAGKTYSVPLSVNKLKRKLIVEILHGRGKVDLDTK
jgi:hypothetical protein